MKHFASDIRHGCDPGAARHRAPRWEGLAFGPAEAGFVVCGRSAFTAGEGGERYGLRCVCETDLIIMESLCYINNDKVVLCSVVPLVSELRTTHLSQDQYSLYQSCSYFRRRKRMGSPSDSTFLSFYS